MKHALNIAKNASITMTSFELLYEIKSRELLTSLQETCKFNDVAKNFILNRQILRNETYEVIKIVQTKMTLIYDRHHKISELSEKIFIKMIKTKKIGYKLSNSSFLIIKKVKSFIITRKINDVTYELKLSEDMRMHNVIFVIHLKQTYFDEYERRVPTPSSREYEEKKLYVIERIMRKRTQNETPKYIIKWKRYKEQIWESADKIKVNVSNMIKAFKNKRVNTRRRVIHHWHFDKIIN